MLTTTNDRRVASLFQSIAGFFKGPSGPKCPECGSTVIGDVCPNLDCPLKIAEWLLRWCSPKAVNIPALGQAEAEQLAGLRLVLHPGELYDLGQGDWDRLDGVSAGQLAKILNQIEDSKSAKPCALLHGLRLPGVSGDLAKRLVKEFGSIAALRDAKAKSLQETDGVDESLAFGIRRWFRDSVNRQALQVLEQNGFDFVEQ